jgi:transcriptional regulator with XRE-family HTH domain
MFGFCLRPRNYLCAQELGARCCKYLRSNVSPMSYSSVLNVASYRHTKAKPFHNKPCRISQQPVHNRIMAVLSHVPRYCFKSEKRLAEDCGASASAISRIVTGQSSPSFLLVAAMTKAIEKHTGKHIDPREIISPDGRYPTPSVCTLMGCRGCLSEQHFYEDGQIKEEFSTIKPGQWSGNIPPKEKRVEAKRKEVQ